ncbi:21401_t:CDS:2 [Dentiscutata erythropus]|uniref:21401_t:CDS:1 n=1 Tax=Dentiscutata erythropus TaxID=1348616 RepID=A0A9N9C7G6_9GLOM|nr:21401_t:CDS:2 [Dentiscutata erythropus]
MVTSVGDFKPPRRYVDLVNGCVCPDPSCRPTIFMVTRIINEWIVALKTPLPQNDEL